MVSVASIVNIPLFSGMKKKRKLGSILIAKVNRAFITKAPS